MAEPWLEVAKRLQLGHKRKIKHCGNSPSLSVSSTLKGWRGYCHRCQKTFWEAREIAPSLVDLKAYKGLKSKVSNVSLPIDFQMEYKADEPISSLWMIWLLKAGITQILRTEYSLGYTIATQRAVIPIHSSGSTLETILLRKLNPADTGPKYLMQSSSPQQAVFLSKEDRAKLDKDNRLFDIIVVEDALSAIRVGEWIPSGAVLGTDLGQGKIIRLIQHANAENPRVGLWLDPDKAGSTGHAKIAKHLELMGINSQKIVSEKDPKYLSDVEIVRRLAVDRSAVVADYEEPT